MEPTRSVGDAYFQHHGVTPAPSTSVTQVYPGDWIVVASDGFWGPLMKEQAAQLNNRGPQNRDCYGSGKFSGLKKDKPISARDVALGNVCSLLERHVHRLEARKVGSGGGIQDIAPC